jgi:Ca2+-binding RTX toxin-like protein
LTPITGTSKADTLIGTVYNDILIGSQGRDTLTGAGGNDVFAYDSILDAGDTITDFQPGDKLNFSNLLSSIGYSGNNPLADQYVRITAGTGNSSVVQIDLDGLGSGTPRDLILLRGIDPVTLNKVNNFIF